MKVNRCGCGKEIESDYVSCSSQCWEKYIKRDINVGTITDSQTKGYNGYNHGLDATVSNRGDWKAQAKAQGLRPMDGW
jgi:hypothetical protein